MPNAPLSIRFSPLEKRALKELAKEHELRVGEFLRLVIRAHTDLDKRSFLLAVDSPDKNQNNGESVPVNDRR